ncbi:MAG: phosphoglycolate phosphatase [Pseudomonadota bacterium]
MKAVVFDLDGTLVDSAPDIHAAARRMLADLGRPPLPLADVTRFIGNGAAKMVERCLEATGGIDGRIDAGLSAFRRHYAAAPAVLTRPYDGVEGCLAALAAAGLALGVCTNKPEAPARAVLRGLGLDPYFAAVVGGDSTAALKPDPLPLRSCVDRLGTSLDQAVFVGDSETDAETATRAAIRFALFTGGYRKQPVAAFGDVMAFEHHGALAPRLLALRPAPADR